MRSGGVWSVNRQEIRKIDMRRVGDESTAERVRRFIGL